MYRGAPINGVLNKHELLYAADGTAVIEMATEPRHSHTGGTLHGSCYFKLLDDAAFFAAQAQVVQ